MVRVQKLDQPKKTSGKKLLPGKSFKIDGISVKNNNDYPVYVDNYFRKPSEKKSK